MGSSTSTIERSREGCQINPSRDPHYFRQIESGDCLSQLGNQRALAAINSSLSRMKVCRAASQDLERTLRSEYFTKWDENCDVAEFRGFSRDMLGEFFDKIHEKFKVTGTDIRPKLRGIEWAETWSHKVYEFSFGNVLDSGTIYFGMIALGKEKTPNGDSFDAITCLYKLDFTIAQERVTRRTEEYFLGSLIKYDVSTWYESRSLGFVTQKALKNFCRIKALDAFYKRGLASSINCTSSIDDVD